MGELILPEKEVFNQRVEHISQRIDSISKSNKMAKILNDNFKKWLGSSSMSPLKLTEELDKDRNGVISGDEFGDLLGKMTGERPPEWVVEVVFSFVEATPKEGIPLDDWMAFLAASGLEIPEELFNTPVVITGSIDISPQNVHTGENVSVTVSFNEPVEAYEIRVINETSGSQEDMITPRADMDAPTFDEFVLESDDPGTFCITLTHVGIRLAEERFTVHERVEESVEEHDDSPEESIKETPALPAESTGFRGFIDLLEMAKLRSEARALIADAPAYNISLVIENVFHTLLGDGQHRGGDTVLGKTEDGMTIEVMMRVGERSFQTGQMLDLQVAPFDWSMATRRLQCTEL